MSKDNLQFFISYSHSDMRLKEKLLTSLKTLKHEFKINEIWHDGDIVDGKDIDVEVLNQLNKSDIVLLLVSNHFLNSYYCIEVELKKAIRRMKKKECLVIPIILSDCSISDTLSFAKLKRLPTDGRPICNRRYFQNQSMGCNDVVTGLRRDLLKEFPDSVIPQRKTKPTSVNDNNKDTIYIELYKDGILQQIPVSQDLILNIPKHHKSIHDFRTMMEKTLATYKQTYAKEYKKYKNDGMEMPNEIKLKLLRIFLMDVCSYTKTCITGKAGIKVHFRISKDDKYLGFIASTDAADEKDLASDWATLMTVIPVYEGLIYHSYRLHAPLLKSLNVKLNHKGKNNSIWKDYATFTFHELSKGQTIPLISYCISVHKKYYNINGDTLIILAYLNLGDVIEKIICDYCDICKKIDKTYSLKDIINTI